MNYTVKVTWVDAANNAACIGHDETVTIQAETPEAAAAEAVEAHEYAHGGDLEKYHPVAEVVGRHPAGCSCGSPECPEWQAAQ